MNRLLNPVTAALAIAMLAATAAGADDTAVKPANDPISQAIAGLDPAITHVRVFGEWKTDDRAGRYRVVIRRTGTADVIRFFLQKITDRNAVDATIELTEITENKLVLTSYNFEIDSFGLTLFIETRDGATGDDTTYEVFLQEDGSYEFQPASN